MLIIAALLAALSMLLVAPDKAYASYIDWRTLAILFSLMSVMAGLEGQGVFERLGEALLSRAGSIRQVACVLVGLCFFCSMFITNDVSLITFVPFTFVVLGSLGARAQAVYTVPVVCMQTIAANLGSMLTPIGNPQNLYLYGKSGMSVAQFVELMLPYTAAAFVMLAVWIAVLCRNDEMRVIEPHVSEHVAHADKRVIAMDLALFFLCLLAVMRLVPYQAAFVIVLAAQLVFDRQALRKVDYSLLLTFVALFVLIGNLGRFSIFSDWLAAMLGGREVLTAVLASQVISNVPAALLLSGFTSETQALIIGTNLGGLGTLIASMASLISYRQIVKSQPEKKKSYLAVFTASNLIFLALLLALWRVA